MAKQEKETKAPAEEPKPEVKETSKPKPEAKKPAKPKVAKPEPLLMVDIQSANVSVKALALPNGCIVNIGNVGSTFVPGLKVKKVELETGIVYVFE